MHKKNTDWSVGVFLMQFNIVSGETSRPVSRVLSGRLLSLNDHLSVALRCRRAQATSWKRPGRPVCSRSTVLLRIEFTASACLHATGGLLPPPFHPYLARRGGISLLHLSEGRPWRVLPVILALWSPDFPHAQPFGSYPRSFGLLADGA